MSVYAKRAFVAMALVAAISGCSPRSRPPENNDIVVTKDGRVLLNGKPVSCAKLEAEFRARAVQQNLQGAGVAPPCNQLLLRELRGH